MSTTKELIEKGRQEGWQKGRQLGIQEGRQIGIQEGIQEGIQQGIQEGIQQARQLVINNMLKKGYTLDEIQKVTGMTKTQIKELLEKAD
ncbi:hypothetical protein M1N70_00070 [Peptococcaceae bacterium]|nr:hypothetical protein [Peptococcaceae bacterium]